MKYKFLRFTKSSFEDGGFKQFFGIRNPQFSELDQGSLTGGKGYAKPFRGYTSGHPGYTSGHPSAQSTYVFT